MINEAKLIIAEAKESRLNYAVTGHNFDRIKANMYSIFECYANGIIDWNVSKSKLKTAIREYIHLYPKDERAVEIEIMREEYKRINKYYKQALDAYRVVSEEKMTNKLVAKQKLDESVAKHHSDVFYNKRTLSESELKDISTLQTWDRVMEAYPHLTRHDEDCVRMLENTYDTKDFEFNPRAGHRDQMSHPENLGLGAEPNKLYSPRPKLRPKKLAPATSPRPRMRPANLQMRHDINKALQQAITSEGHSPHKKGTAKYKAHMAAMHAEADENNNGSSTGDKIAQAVGYGLPAGYIAYQMRDRLKGLGQRGANAVKNIPKNIENKKIARQAAADVVRKGQHAARTGLTSIQGGKGSVPDTRTHKPHLRPIDGGRPPKPAVPKPPSPQATNIGGGGGKGKPSILKRAGKTAANIGKGVLGKAALPLAVGIAGYDAARGWRADPNATVGQKFKNAGNSALHGMSFGLLGKDPTNEEVFEYLLQAGITEEALTEWAMEGYKIMPPMDDKYQPRDGLEGPFSTLSGKVVYYDPKEGSYYDPDTDMYMSYDEFQNHDKDYSGMKDERNEVKEHENEYTASDIMSDDLPVGIDFDTSNLPKVNWDMHSVEEIKLFVNNLENLDFEDGLDVNDNGYDGSSGEAAKWVEKNVLSRRSDEVGETLSPEDKALVNKMYNKDGTLTDLGKRVMGTKESRTLENLMSKVFDNALSEFEFNPRAGHRDQPSHPENRGLTPEYPEINVRPKARPTSSAPKTSMRPKLRPANLQMRNDINKAVQQAMGEGDGRKKGIHPKGHPMRSKQQAAIHANEGKMSDSIIVDSETMSKEEFAKKYGTEMANEYYESIAAQNVLDNSILAKENVDKLRKIVSDKSMMPIKFKDGTMNVDMTTANIFVKAFDKMKETNQAKVSEMIKTKAGFLRVMDIIYGAMK